MQNKSQRSVTFWQLLFFAFVLCALNPVVGIVAIVLVILWKISIESQ